MPSLEARVKGNKRKALGKQHLLNTLAKKGEANGKGKTKFNNESTK